MPNEIQGGVVPNDSDDAVIIDVNDTDGLTKNLNTSIQQKKYWRDKAKAESAEKQALLERIKEFEKSATPLEKKEEGPKPSDFDSIADNLEVIRELKAHELVELRAVSKDLNVDPVKYIKSKAGQAHLKEIRATQQIADTTPAPSSRIPVFNGKPVNEILKSEKASPEEKQAAWEARMGKKGSNQYQ